MMNITLPTPAELELVPIYIKWCIQNNNTLLQTRDFLFTRINIPPIYTQIVWETLERENPQLFQAYYDRMNLLYPNGYRNAHISNGGDYLYQIQEIQWNLFIDMVKEYIHISIQLNMTKQETVHDVFIVHKILPALTQEVWEILEEQDPQFFQAYYERGIRNSNGAHNVMHHQNGGGYMAPNGAQNVMHHQTGGGYMAPNGAQNGGGYMTPNGAQNVMHHQTGGGYMAPNGAQNGGGYMTPNGAQNVMHHQNGGGYMTLNGAQNGMHRQNDGGYMAPNGAHNMMHHQNGRRYMAPNGAQNVMHHQNSAGYTHRNQQP